MNVLLVGLGSIAKTHIKALLIIDSDTRFFALRSSSQNKNFPDVQNIYKLNELEGITIDFAIISNPTALHRKAISDLIPLNIPLFIEKPLFSNLDNLVILEELKRKEIKTYVACNLRFLDSLLYTKSLIDNERINEVNVYCGSYLPNWRPGVDYKTTYSAQKKLGGGVHIDLIHEIDYIFWFFGKPMKTNKIFTNKSSLDIDAFDYANYLLEYKQFNVNIILNYFRRDAKRSLEIVTNNYTLNINLLTNQVFKDNELIFSSNKSILDTYEDQLRFFIKEILLGENIFNSAFEAFEVLKICL